MWSSHFLSNKVIEIQAGDENKNWLLELSLSVTVLFQTSCQSLDLLQAKRSDSTGIQNLDKLPETEFLVAEISVLNLQDSTTNLEARLQS